MATAVRTAVLSSEAPELTETQVIARIEESRGKGAFTVITAGTTESRLVHLPPRFRNTVWIRRGSFVVVEWGADDEVDSCDDGVIVHVLTREHIKDLKKSGGWPEGLKEVFTLPESESEAESESESEQEQEESEDESASETD